MPPKAAGKGGKEKKKIDQGNVLTATALKVTYLSSCKAMLQPPNAQLLAVLENAIEFGKSIEKLTFRDDELGAQGMRAVMDMLAGYSKLKNLCLWRCRLGNAGIAAICDYLRGSTDKWSKMSPLRLLEITCDYDPPLLEPFPPPLSTSAAEETELQTAPSPPTAKPKEAWSAASQEKKVTISTPPPIDMGYDLPGAEQKNIKIDLDMLEQLGSTIGKQRIVLRVLVLDHNGMGDEGARLLCLGLRQSTSLQQLSLAYNNIGGHGATHIAPLLQPTTLCPLMALNLQGNYLGNEGLVAIAGSLPVTSTLQVLNLASNRIDSNLAVVRTFCECLVLNNTLVKVDFNFNHLNTDAVKELLPVIASKPNIIQFRIAPRIQKEIADELFMMLAERNKKKKGKGKGKKKK